jgi:starch synthase
MSKLKLLYVSSEVAPFSKTGGLADVAGSLPLALAKQNIDVRVVMPKFHDLAPKYKKELKSIGDGSIDMLFRAIGFEIFMLKENDVTYYFIEHNLYFNREGYYGYGDDGERFTFFCKAVLEMLPVIGFQPNIIHANDWQTAITNFLLRSNYLNHEFYKEMKTVFTIHNMKYQGVFPKDIMHSLLSTSWEHFTYDRIEFYDQVNYLKAAINYSDVITTVSKTYAEEINHDFFAENLGGTIRARSNSLHGILNGIDFKIFNPETDPKIFKNYSSHTLEGKSINKLRLQESLDLPTDPAVPMIGLVTRLVEQKGIDLIEGILGELIDLNLQLVIIGTGEYRYEEMFKYYSTTYPHKVHAEIKYDDTLAHRIYAGSDMFLVPSLFEPCGLSQMISMRYGTVPIVRETGGLKDTVIPYNKYTGEGTGFSFSNYNAHELLFIIKDALNLYQDTETFKKLVVNGMNKDFSWDHSALEYIKLYKNLL